LALQTPVFQPYPKEMTGIFRLRMPLRSDRRKDEEPLGKRLARESTGTARVCAVEVEQRQTRWLGAGRLADRGYDGDGLRAAIASRGAWANIKPMPHRVNITPLQQTLALQGYRNSLRKARRQLPRPRQACRIPHLDAVYVSVT
jgi:hypothetical protein